MSIALDIVGGVLIAGTAGWVLRRPPNDSPDRRRCLGIGLEEAILGAATIGGTLMFLAAKLV